MGLFKRVSDNIRANLNALLDKVEDPETILNQYLRDMEEDIAEAEVAVAKQMAVAWKFKAQWEDAKSMAERREAQAIEALKINREDLARKALEEKRANQAKAEEYRKQYESNNAVAEQLKKQLKEMKSEYEKLRNKRDTLVARAKTAKAQKEVLGAMGGFGKDNTRRNFERMEEKVFQMEAEAKVMGDFKEKDFDLELEALEREKEIDRELAELKAKLSLEQE